jgi:hypothetical protein
MAQATAPRPNLWLGFITGRADDSMQRLMAYIEEVSLLSSQLVYFDLESIGIDPLLARLLVLARLLADGAPISFLRDEVSIATADVIKSRSIENQPPVLLFSQRMQVEPITSPALSEDDTSLRAPSFDWDKWSKAMAQQPSGSA